MTGHWTPWRRDGAECRFCRGPLMIRNREDAQAYFACHDARFPPFYTRLRGLVSQFERATR